VSRGTCPLCGGTGCAPVFRAREFVLHRTEYQLVSCTDCGHVFVDPAPDSAELEAYYARAVPALRALYPDGEAGPAESAVEREKIELLRARGLLERPGRVLDVGFGGGGFLLAMAQLGWSATGIEFTSDVQLPFDPAGRFEVLLGRDAATRLEDEAFDVITLWHVLEHLQDPVRELARLRRALRPEGRLVVAVPNAGGLTARLFKGSWFGATPPWHLQQFAPRTLSRAINDAGYAVDVLAGFGDLAMRLYWVESLTEVMERLPGRWYRGAARQALRVVRKAASLSLPALLAAERAAGLPGAIVAIARRNPLLDAAPVTP
jgi:SAM-dependent methyltransferase